MNANINLFKILLSRLLLLVFASIFASIFAYGQYPSSDCVSKLSVKLALIPGPDANVTTDLSGFSVQIPDLHTKCMTDSRGRCDLSIIQGTDSGVYSITASKSWRGNYWEGVKDVMIESCSGSSGIIQPIDIPVSPTRR